MKHINRDDALPKNIYEIHLTNMGGFSLTCREMDVIACIVNGRSAKKIASLLSISPRTVENHIRNILLKIGRKTQEGIIDFIEQSGKYKFVKQYYTSLLLYDAFERELKKIAVLLGKSNLGCMVMASQESTDKAAIDYLQKHLQMVGVKVYVKDISQGLPALYPNTHDRHHVLYVLPTENIDAAEDKKHLVSWQVASILEQPTFANTPITVLCLSSLVESPTLENVAHIHLKDHRNYFYMAFALLKRLFPEIALEKHTTAFSAHHDGLHDDISDKADEQHGRLVDKPMQSYKQIFRCCIVLLVLGVIGTYAWIEWVNKKGSEVAVAANRQESLSNPSLLAQASIGKSIVWNLPPQHHQFIGRTALLEALASHLQLQTAQVSTANTAFKVAVCTGLGGVGKTQLALQYVHHTTFPYTLKAWFSAENVDQLKRQYLEFAKFLGLEVLKPSLKTAMLYIKEWLLNHPGWLIVYDNVTSYEVIKDYLLEGEGNIIITTRQREWPTMFQAVDVNVMTEPEALALIESFTQRNLTAEENVQAKDLVQDLGYLPLALVQAGAYLRQNMSAIGEYLTFYKQHAQAILDKGLMPKGVDHLPLMATWNVTLQAILKEAKAQHQPPLAIELLHAAAYLAPETIPQHFLLTWLKTTHPEISSPELVLSEMVGQLWKYSMISKTNAGNIIVHRLVQAAIQNQHNNIVKGKGVDGFILTRDWYVQLLRTAHVEFYHETDRALSQTYQKKILPHLQALVNHYRTLWSDQMREPLIGDIMWDLGYVFYYGLFDAKTAVPYYQAALENQQKHYGNDHIEIAKILRGLGSAHKELGEYTKAKSCFEDALNIYQKHGNQHHIEIAATLRRLGFLEVKFGNYDKAKLLFEQALNIYETAHIVNEPDMAFALEGLGILKTLSGSFNEAEVLLNRALSILETHYGLTHPQTAYVLRSLGLAHSYLGNHEHGIALLKQALEIHLKACDQDNSTIAITMHYLGLGYTLAGRFDSAKEFLERALVMQQRLFGNTQHPDLARTLVDLGYIYQQKKDFKAAKAFLSQGLAIQQNIYGINHPDVVLTRAKYLNISQGE